MRGLGPRIHAFLRWCVKGVDGRVKPDHDAVRDGVPHRHYGLCSKPGYLAARSFSAAAAAK